MTQFKQLYTHITSLYYELAPPKYKDPIPANFKPSSGHQNAGSTTQPPKRPPKRKASPELSKASTKTKATPPSEPAPLDPNSPNAPSQAPSKPASPKSKPSAPNPEQPLPASSETAPLSVHSSEAESQSDLETDDNDDEGELY